MINYNDGYFGLPLLFRLYGSAAYKSTVFATLSSCVYLLFFYYGSQDDADHEEGYKTNDVDPRNSAQRFAENGGIKHINLLDHPYPVTVIVTAFMFLLSSKVTFAYNRYWEACTALHNMHAKWLDVGSTIAAFHMQSQAYDNIRPPSFGDHHDINEGYVLRHVRTQETEDTDANSPRKRTIMSGRVSDSKKSRAITFGSFLTRRRGSRGTRSERKGKEGTSLVSIYAACPPKALPFPDYSFKSCRKMPQIAESNIGNNKGDAFRDNGEPTVPPFDDDSPHTSRTAPLADSVADAVGGFERSVGPDKNTGVPSLFLQEAAHLLSLLSAVALSTLRCEAEDAEAPLTEFVPGKRWPNYNSENDPTMKEHGYRTKRIGSRAKYILDVSRTKRERTEYNAARPFPVVGGVSDREAALLQSARGSAAKTALAFLWLNEFIIREQQHGSLGATAPPIVSRLQQYSSDGHLWYNAARKMSYVPFPFPHAQLTAMFEIVSLFVIPCLMLSKTEVWFGLILNFFTVMLFSGLNELSKELEYPFRGMPNDLPLNLFQAQFNEALVTVFSGFHPGEM
ncbi:hypothetical protein ACHAWF_010376 [Thalassiosira exigua]